MVNRKESLTNTYIPIHLQKGDKQCVFLIYVKYIMYTTYNICVCICLVEPKRIGFSPKKKKKKKSRRESWSCPSLSRELPKL